MDKTQDTMIVLYAEDDLEDLEIFCEIMRLIDPAIKCLNARDGKEALEILESSVVLPDYVFLDINMPTMDGRSCLKHIKKDERFRVVPVFIYTTSSNKKDIELCKQLGAADYIIKPNTVQEAIQTLSKALAPGKLASQ